MDAKTWAQITAGLMAPLLVLQLYLAFIAGPKNHDLAFCEYISDNYPTDFNNLMNTNEQLKTTCCSFEEFNGYAQCHN